MYPVSDAFMQAIKSNTRKYYWTGTITTSDKKTYEFGNEDIVKGNGYISRQCCGNSEIELGSVYAAELGISRQGVHDQVKRVDKLLAGYEERLMLVKRFLDLKAKVGRIRETVSECTADNLEEVKKTVAEISDSIMEEL